MLGLGSEQTAAADLDNLDDGDATAARVGGERKDALEAADLTDSQVTAVGVVAVF